MMKTKDTIYNSPLNEIVDFKFDDRVANVFEDMLNRSIPGYSTVISIIGMLTKSYIKSNSNCYDLGTSLGAAALSMRHNISVSNCSIIAVDFSQSMINRAGELITKEESNIPVKLICDDIRNIKFENASIVVLNYTLQFIPPEDREKLISDIYKGMLEGGILILSEKIKFEDPKENERQIENYHEFKRLNGYSDLEISQKREALENVLIPETIEIHKTRLLNAGFANADKWYQCFNFISMIAQK